MVLEALATGGTTFCPITFDMLTVRMIGALRASRPIASGLFGSEYDNIYPSEPMPRYKASTPAHRALSYIEFSQIRAWAARSDANE
jgi:hypothetical protein